MRAAAHSGARQHAFTDNFRCEAMRGDDRHFAALYILHTDHAAHAAKVIAVAVGIDYRTDRAFAQRAVGKIKTGGSRRCAEQGVDDDPSAFTLNQRHDRQIISADLVNPGHDFKQAVDRGKLALSPERRVDRGRRRPIEKVEFTDRPGDRTVGIDDILVELCQKAAACIGKVAFICQRQSLCDCGIAGGGSLGRFPCWRCIGHQHQCDQT